MKPIAIIMLLLIVSPLTADAQETTEASDQRLFTLDERQWVLFYDLPSRRFRNIRDNLISGNIDVVTRDLQVSSSYIRIEAGRAEGKLADNLNAVANALAAASDANAQDELTIIDLNPIFARSHWLLAQHYLLLAQSNRLAERHRNAGHYLAATTHHLERAILWSDLRPTRKMAITLEDLTILSNELLDKQSAAKAYRERPIRKAWQLAQEVGDYIDRKPSIQPSFDVPTAENNT